ncbi:nicotinamide-nucleotide amidase [Vibrio sp. SS-MA-C1-2]|uniref:nicotinamide-nucleotide amidase n=1 Tax=Vibrio sp. SS-MA-C1-2 TaxID=2908646 RepID=UPI001F456625|nr:nicotinamide-nucleotide amidase [Vibrio sp. SS-MA-C1-2]UJF19015.1 nicotinamide-nucleotide amidase [Vibrio sp. SS-MA-C1-2]
MMSDYQQQIEQASEHLGKYLAQHHLVAVTAESCTGGGVASAITDISGSSAWFDRSFVTYTNQAKEQMLGVQHQTLVDHGAVSQSVVEEMAIGALRHSNGDISVAISGIAGPGGGTENKPVGTVWFAWAARNGQVISRCLLLEGDRKVVRYQAVVEALNGLVVISESMS